MNIGSIWDAAVALAVIGVVGLLLAAGAMCGLFIALRLGGNYNAYKVFRGKNKDELKGQNKDELNGIPFFLKQRKYTEISTFLEPLAVVELRISAAKGIQRTVFVGRRTIRWNHAGSATIDELLAIGSLLTQSEFDGACKTFSKLEQWNAKLPEKLPAWDQFLYVGTRRTSRVETDYSTRYYVNARRGRIFSDPRRRLSSMTRGCSRNWPRKSKRAQ